MARALKFAWDCGRAWMLLLPDFVSHKSYYKDLSQSTPPGAAPWFIGPRHRMCDLARTRRRCLFALMPCKRYTFAAPRTGHTGGGLVDANIRHVSSHGASVFAAPFQCVWFLQLAAAGHTPRVPCIHVQHLAPFQSSIQPQDGTSGRALTSVL